MKVSLNSIRGMNKRYGTADDVAAIGADKIIDKVGAQLGGIDEIINVGSKYQGIVIVKVVECEKHPDADKLHVCTIDDGGVVKDVDRDDNGYVQVVCGAPNVRAGLSVAWLPPGAIVPESVGREPFVLSKREIRGVVSNGMLASPKELALGDSHEGLLEIDDQHAPGSDFAEAFELKDDIVLDIENKMFTHRPDLFGFLGISRELAGIQQLPFKSPDWYTQNPAFPDATASELPFEIHNELPELVPRFTAIVLSGVKVGPSPVWLQVELAKAGQKSINNIVDYTNFFMLETGQPLHAYDYDKVKALSGGKATIVVRNPHSGEKLTLLNGKEVEPRPEAILIATDKQAIGLGGVMGGAETEVDSGTKNIILECATFDMYSIRRTSMAHGIFSEAVTRFTKGQSPLQNLAVLAKIVDEVCQYAGGQVAGPVLDDNHLEPGDLERGNLFPPVTVSTAYINERLGLQLDAGDIQTLLENVEFKVEADGDKLIVHAPFWRTDIELREDVVEEVGRLHGYDKLPLELPKRDLTPTVKDPLLEAKKAVRNKLSAAGANEVLTYSFVHGNLLEKVGQDPQQAFQLSNALSPDLQYYRLSLVPSLLDKVHPNIKAGYKEFALFELGKTHGSEQGKDDAGLPREFEFTALIYVADDKLKKPGAAFYEARKYLTTLVSELALEFRPIGDMSSYAVTKPYDEKRSALVYLKGGEFLGIIGEFKQNVRRSLKLPAFCSGFEIDTEVLQKLLAAGPSYAPLPRFPKVVQDITLAVDVGTTFADIYAFIDTELGANAPDDTHILLEAHDIYQNPETPARKHFSFRITITAANRTLTDKEVTKVLDMIAAAAKEKFGAERL